MAFREKVGLTPVSSLAKLSRGVMAKHLNSPVLWDNGRRLDRYIDGEALDQRYGKRSTEGKPQAAEEGQKNSRYVVDLALDTYKRDFQDSGKKFGISSGSASEGMDPGFRKSAIDQIKTFIFAGHDTISSTMAWIFYFYTSTPRYAPR